MELDVGGNGTNVETVEVVSRGEEAVIDPTRLSNHSTAAGLLEQQLTQEILVPTTEVQVETQGLSNQALDPSLAMVGMSQQASIITIPVEPTSPGGTQQALQLVGAKRTLKESVSSDQPVGLLESAAQPNIEVPRKKSRNYLDSHKTIEKKRRDRINQCLDNLKSLVPDCRQYGSKKLDKAEILEMSIEYIKRMQAQGSGRNSANLDLALNQREWANDLTTWVIHNKLLYSGSNSLDQFCQALLLHLQGMGSGNALASATSMLLNQTSTSNEEDSLLRQQTVNAQTAILQQLQQQQQQASSPKESGSAPGTSNSSSGSNNAQQQLQQAQLTQLQALLLLQQQQQLLSQQQQQESDAQAQQTHLQQLQQLQQLQALLLQHIANEASSSTSVLNGSASEQKISEQGSSSGAATQTTSVSDGETVDSSVLTAANPMTSEAAPSSGGEELTQTEDLGAPVTTEETVYTSTITDTLEENLLTVNVAVNQADTQTEMSGPTGQMWSSAGSGRPSQSSSLLLLGGSESEGEGGLGEKTQLMEAAIDSEVQEEVELMAQQEQ